jgi:hypothetical protein
MALLALLAIVIQTGVGWVVSVRLLRLARRTHELPELVLGVSTLLAIGLGYPLLVASAATDSVVLRAAGALSVDVGFVLVATFTWRVFRTADGWAAALVAGLALGLVVQLGVVVRHQEAAGVIQMLLASAVYGWTALEASIHARMHRRRIALGIGDPVVANRLWLWCVMGATSVFAALLNALTILFGIMPLENPAVLIVTTASGLVQATTLLLALAPPAAYLGWLARQRAA